MTNSKHVPKRRFKDFELDSEWELKKLGDFGSVEMCKRIFKNETSDKFDIPFYKINCKNKCNIYSNSSSRASQAVL